MKQPLDIECQVCGNFIASDDTDAIITDDTEVCGYHANRYRKQAEVQKKAERHIRRVIKSRDKNGVIYWQLNDKEVAHIDFYRRRIYGKEALKHVLRDGRVNIGAFFAYRRYQWVHGTYKRLCTLAKKDQRAWAGKK